MIVLYNPKSTFSPRVPMPLSLLAVASTLEGRRETVIIDGNLEPDPVGRIRALAEGPGVEAIGLTVMPGPQLSHAVSDTRALDRAFPDVPIVWGGYFPSQHAETVLRDGTVDVCVRGQGEDTFPKLLDALIEGGSLADIEGISFRDGDPEHDGRIVHNPNRKVVELDPLPDWPYEKIPIDRYLFSHYLGSKVGAHQTSYGCPFACNFCAIVELVNRRWVGQAPERVERIVRMQHERWGADAIQFHDMDFFIHEARVREIAERIAPLGMAWWALGRVDELMRYSEDTWDIMAKSGLKMVFCGAEAGSEEVLARMNKGGKVSPDLTLELARRMKHYGVVPEFSFVLGSPPEPMADIDRTIRFVRQVKEVNPATEVILYMYTPVPKDGLLFEEAKALGFRFPETLDEWTSDGWRSFALRRDPSNPWLNPKLQRKVRDFERVLNAYYPTTTDLSIRGMKRAVLRGLGGWRYKTRFYHRPLELRLFHRLFQYQRPETTGF